MTVLRAITAADAMACAALQEDSFGVLQTGSGIGFSEKQVHEELVRPWSRLWGLFDDGALATTASTQTGLASNSHAYRMLGCLIAWHVLDELHLLNIAVASDARQRGYGRQLMLALLSYGTAQKAQCIILEVRVDNLPAKSLYERFGFQTTRVRKNYYGGTLNDPAVDGLEMILSPLPSACANETPSERHRKSAAP